MLWTSAATRLGPATTTPGGTVHRTGVVSSVREDTSAVAPVAAVPAPAREVRVAITVNARGSEAPAALAQSGRQVARAVRRALAGED